MVADADDCEAEEPEQGNSGVDRCNDWVATGERHVEPEDCDADGRGAGCEENGETDATAVAPGKQIDVGESEADQCECFQRCAHPEQPAGTEGGDQEKGADRTATQYHRDQRPSGRGNEEPRQESKSDGEQQECGSPGSEQVGVRRPDGRCPRRQDAERIQNRENRRGEQVAEYDRDEGVGDAVDTAPVGFRVDGSRLPAEEIAPDSPPQTGDEDRTAERPERDADGTPGSRQEASRFGRNSCCSTNGEGEVECGRAGNGKLPLEIRGNERVSLAEHHVEYEAIEPERDRHGPAGTRNHGRLPADEPREARDHKQASPPSYRRRGGRHEFWLHTSGPLDAPEHVREAKSRTSSAEGSSPQTTMFRTTMTVGIVGGGLTGLALHHYLDQQGTDSVVFEAAAEPGGVIKSQQVDGRTLDYGPQRTRLSKPVESLVEELGIGDQLRKAADGPLYVYRDGALRRVPFTLRTAIKTDLLSLRGKLRLLLEPLTGPPRAGETVEECLTRTVGTEAAAYLVGPLYGGIYGSNPGEMPMEHSLLRALEKFDVDRSLLAAGVNAKLRRSDPPPVVSFDGGMQTLPRALYEHHQDRIHLETPVETVRAIGDQFELGTESRGTVVDQVVLTTPAAVSGQLLGSLARETAAALTELTYNPLVLVHVKPEPPIHATGFQVQYDEPYRTLGVTCNASLFEEDDHVTCFLGGAKTPELVDWPTAKIRETALGELSELAGVDGVVVDVHRLPRGMPAYDTSWRALEGLETPDGVHICGNYRSRAGIPGRIGEAKQLAPQLSETKASTDGR